jgi:hypothetical protein
MSELIIGALISGIIGIITVLAEQGIIHVIEKRKIQKRKIEFFQELYEMMFGNACEESYIMLGLLSDKQKEWIRQMGAKVRYSEKKDTFSVFGYHTNHDIGYHCKNLVEYEEQTYRDMEKKFRNDALYKFVRTLEIVHDIKVSDKNNQFFFGDYYEKLKIEKDLHFNIKDRRWC